MFLKTEVFRLSFFSQIRLVIHFYPEHRQHFKEEFGHILICGKEAR